MVSISDAELFGKEQLGVSESRALPQKVTIPAIKGEMSHLRPATIEDLATMDAIDAFYGASSITGKSEAAERSAVHAWVSRSQAWANDQIGEIERFADPEARGTMAWTMLADPDNITESIDQANTIIGMIFLVDIDSWAKSARIQVILGHDYRGRGYSRDAMPRVLIYGFAPEEGLGLHRIWVSVPEKNTRSRTVYQSLGVVPEGVSRDALWDSENNKYQDSNVFAALADEFDLVRSLETYGMRTITSNPGVKEALAMREHSIEIAQKNSQREAHFEASSKQAHQGELSQPAPLKISQQNLETEEKSQADVNRISVNNDDEPGKSNEPDEPDHGHSSWAYLDENNEGNQQNQDNSKQPWWRRLGNNRKREGK